MPTGNEHFVSICLTYTNIPNRSFIRINAALLLPFLKKIPPILLQRVESPLSECRRSLTMTVIEQKQIDDSIPLGGPWATRQLGCLYPD